MPLGTSQISTRRFLASLTSTSAPLRSLGAAVDTAQEVGSDFGFLRGANPGCP